LAWYPRKSPQVVPPYPKITILSNNLPTVRFIYGEKSAVIFNCFSVMIIVAGVKEKLRERGLVYLQL
jgi:hypothetical protein